MRSQFLVIIPIVLLCFSCTHTSDKILFVADHQVQCADTIPRKCLQIKENNATEWTSFYDQIEGFNYEKGFFYKLKVEVQEMADSISKGSTIHYRLMEIQEKSLIPLNLDQGSWLVIRIRDRDGFNRNPFIKIDLSKSEINGNTSCNRFSAKIEVKNRNVQISKLTSTEMLCKTTDIEAVFLKALNEISSYSLTDEKLQFLDSDNALLIECEYLKHE